MLIQYYEIISGWIQETRNKSLPQAEGFMLIQELASFEIEDQDVVDINIYGFIRQNKMLGVVFF